MKKALLGRYTYMKGKNDRSPLPNHLSKSRPTIASFDNFDHDDKSSISGTKSNHDSVVVVFQKCSPEDQISRKPNISECENLIPCTNLTEKLPCQKLETYARPPDIKKLPLPPSLPTGLPDPGYEDNRKSEIISAVRTTSLPNTFQRKNMMPKPNMKDMPTWSGASALTTPWPSNHNLHEAGFMPILPHPITKHETVYTILVNFKFMVDSLDQDAMAIVCDEGVYQYVMDIYMHDPSIFQNIFPMLGGFHLAKNALRCAGKYLRGSGIEDSLIENHIFGTGVTETVLAGSHYYRSFVGLSIVEDAILQLRADAFWEANDPTIFSEDINSLVKLQDSLIAWDTVMSKFILESITTTGSMYQLIDSLKQFGKTCSEKSEMCTYFENFLVSMKLIKDFIRADREANFLLHIKATHDLLSLFTGGDGINYQRCASFYYELLKGLPSKHPDLYLQMISGGFVVKTNPGKFNSVSPDMKLEQSINRSAKSTHGIIGQTRSLNYVTQWQLLYHEVLSISNLFLEITCPSIEEDEETVVHHDLSKSKIKEINESIHDVKMFISDRGNPYLLGDHSAKLKNISSQILASPIVSEKILKFHNLSIAKFESFQDVVYRKRTTLIGETIHKFNLLPINHKVFDKSADSKDVKVSKKEIKAAKQLLKIVAQRVGGDEDVLKYDITPFSPLFERQYMTNAPDKSLLTSELEAAYLSPRHYEMNDIPLSTCLIVDFMSFIRGEVIKSTQYPTFGHLVTSMMTKIMATYPNRMVHIVFDSYVVGSLKGAERGKRGSEILELAKIDAQTKVPNQIDKFWGSSSNKENLQQFFSDALLQMAKENNINIVLSGKVVGQEVQPCRAFIDHQEYSDIEPLKSSLEEADSRVISHLHWSLTCQGIQNFVVLSNDTDVLVLILHYYRQFKDHGIQKTWIRMGSGVKKRLLPVHHLYNRMPKPLVAVLLATHIGTGCDYLSKIGTKLASLNAIPEMYLEGFGKKELDDMQMLKCEEYLVKVFKSNTECKTFDSLRAFQYRNNESILDLPPTSHSIIHGHIQRWYFLVKELSNLLNPHYEPLNPCHYQWTSIDEELLPIKNLLPIPEDVGIICSCKHKDIAKRCGGRCSCFKKGATCTDQCGCRKICSNVPPTSRQPKRKQPSKKSRRTRQRTI